MEPEDTSTDDASTQEAVTDDAQSDAGGAQEEEKQDAPLGSGGEKALAAERLKRKKAEQEHRAAKERIAALERGGDEAAQERANFEKAAMAKANARLVRAEVKTAAAGVLSDPGDAAQFLDLTAFDVNDDGEVDTEEIRAAIADLVKKKPYLAAQAGKFQGTGDGGARKKQTGPTLEEQIAEAEKAGNWKRVISLNNQKLAKAAGQ